MRLASTSHDMAVDLGTANTIVYACDSGVLRSEPSIVAVDRRTGELQAVGNDAWQILGHKEICAVRPVQGGVIADLDVTEQMLSYLLDRMQGRRRGHPRVVASVPSGVSGVEKRAVAEVCLAAGARETYLIDRPIAVAIGAGLPVAQPTGSMVVDIGAASTEVAVVAMGGIVVSRSLRVGGQQLDDAIAGHLKREHKVLIGQQTAEQIKVQIGSASCAAQPAAQIEVRGREIGSQALKAVALTADEIRWVLAKPLTRTIDAVLETLDCTPPELGSDILDRGITLAGGGALLHGLAQRLSHETGMPAWVAVSPRTCVAVGAAAALERLTHIPRSRATARGELALGSTAVLN
ncbi:MAG: rod shape-determining protein [Solirubrobacteraceae bacterium]